MFDPINPPLDPLAAPATPATTSPSPFQWGSGGMKRDPLEVRRSIASALMSKGTSTAPIQSWAQGLDRAAAGMLGGYESGLLDEERAKLYQPQPRVQTTTPPMAASSTSFDATPPAPGFGFLNPLTWGQ